MKQLQQHLASLQDEISQLRLSYNASKTTIVGLESYSRTQDVELQDLRKRYAIIVLFNRNVDNLFSPGLRNWRTKVVNSIESCKLLMHQK